MEPLAERDSVRIYDGKGYKQKAKVISQNDSHSYQVQTEDGAIYRRNRRHLLATKESNNHQQDFKKQSDLLSQQSKDQHQQSQPQQQLSPQHHQHNQQIKPTEPVKSQSNQKHTSSGRISKKPSRYIEEC